MATECKLCGRPVYNSPADCIVTCEQCVEDLIIFDLPFQKATEELKQNQYYLIVSNFGYVLKTKFKPEFNIIKKWEGVVFAQIVSNNQDLFLRIGDKEIKKKVSQIPVSDPYRKDMCFDFKVLELNNGSLIKKVWLEEKYGKLRL